jgi:hypothetical protein
MRNDNCIWKKTGLLHYKTRAAALFFCADLPKNGIFLKKSKGILKK